jgi:hypothetical protein
VKAVQDAQAVLRDHCTKAAFASGRAQYSHHRTSMS